MGIFDPNMIHISHKSIRSEELTNNVSIYIEVEVIDYNPNADLESVILYWKYSAEDGPFGEVVLELQSEDIYAGTFPTLNSNSEIEYFITVTNSIENIVSHPITGWHIFETLGFNSGDINGDNFINIKYIVLLINLVLSNGYNAFADLNSDQTVDILDIVQLVNIILGE